MTPIKIRHIIALLSIYTFSLLAPLRLRHTKRLEHASSEDFSFFNTRTHCLCCICCILLFFHFHRNSKITDIIFLSFYSLLNMDMTHQALVLFANTYSWRYSIAKIHVDIFSFVIITSKKAARIFKVLK